MGCFFDKVSARKLIVQCHNPALCEVEKLILMSKYNPWTKIFWFKHGDFQTCGAGHYSHFFGGELIKHFKEYGNLLLNANQYSGIREPYLFPVGIQPDIHRILNGIVRQS